MIFMSTIYSIRTRKVMPIFSIIALVTITFLYTTFSRNINPRPIMHTFYHLRSPEEDQVVELWKKEWYHAGFDTRVLTLEDAARHPAFEEVQGIMEPLHGSGSHEAMCFYRWFAMASLGGGWMSDSDTFPIRFPINEGTNLPNDGTFTSFQGHAPALMSGTGAEWNRVANLLVDTIAKIPGEAKTDMFAFEVLRHQQNTGIFYYFPPENVHRGFAYDTPRKVNCKKMSKVRAVHISRARTHDAVTEGLYPIVSYDDKNTEYLNRADAYNIFLNDWKNQCSKYVTTNEDSVVVVAKRPIMHTFYHSIDSEAGMEYALRLWREEWERKGFDTKILNLEDAKKHPDFEEIEKIMIPLHGSTGYNAICFYRWFAMVVSGGGWMSDHDTFPTNFPVNEGIDLPNGGKFTSFQAHIPALMSGTAAEWNRVARLVIDAIPRVAEDVVTSDMHAFNVLRKEDSADVIFMTPYINYVQEGFIYDSPRVVNCQKMSTVRAVHISHALTHQAILDGLYPLEPDENDPVGKDHRAEASKVFLDDWRNQCDESTGVKTDEVKVDVKVDIPRPLMHTYSHSMGQFEAAVVELWKEEWTNAGFDVKVLTFEDAKKHPDFNRVETDMIHLLVSRGQDPLPFYQWMAMAMSGGGWISAYDTFPTNFDVIDATTLPNGGTFTSYQDTIPSLMSGSSDEWGRVSKLLIDAIPRIEGVVKSVTLAFDILKQDGDTNIIFMEPDLNVQEGLVYVSPRKVNCDNMLRGKVVKIDLSLMHRAISDGLYPLDVTEDDPNGDHQHAEASKLFLDDWRNQCGKAALAS